MMSVKECGDAGEMNVMFPLLRLGCWGYTFFGDINIFSSVELDIVNVTVKLSNTYDRGEQAVS